MIFLTETQHEALRQYSGECRKAFAKLLNELLDRGLGHDLPREAVGIAICVASIHAQALSIVGANLSIESFDGILAADVTELQNRHVRGKVIQ
jgi:hypothetical protein